MTLNSNGTNRIIGTIFLVLISYNVKAQHNKIQVPDSLISKEYEYLKVQYQLNKAKPVALFYANTWLYKSKLEKNYEQMALAYNAIMYKQDKQDRLLYTDSILNAALFSKDDQQIAAAFLTKGAVYFDLKKYPLALDNYLTADGYVAKTDNDYLKYKIKYTIAQTKMYLGFYEEAIALFTECLAFFKEENDRAYLNTVHSLGLCFNKTKRYDLCSKYNQMGLDAGKYYEISEMDPYFKHSEGINQYFLQNYKTAIELLNYSLPAIRERKDSANEIVGMFYLGKCYLASNQYEKAIPYFFKVDHQINKENFYRPDLRENFEIIIDYYKKKRELRNELKHTSQLLKVDSLLGKNFRYLSQKIVKEYDTKELVQSISEIEFKLWRNNTIYRGIIFSLIGGVIYLVYRHFKNLKKYQHKFDELISNSKVREKPIIAKEDSTELYISPEVTALIVKNLEKFENSKKFLEKDITTGRLAEILRTNSKYITQVIRTHRGGKPPFTYISDLKIDYLVASLQKEKTYRNYTNKALAELLGFGSTQNFTTAFKTRIEMSPTFFLKKIRETNKPKN